MKVSLAGVGLIKRFEGLRLRAYRCSAGRLTIGWGHTGDVSPGAVITEHQAEAILSVDLESAERAVERCVDVPLTQGQFDALVSFVFNLGEGRLAGSTLLRKLNAGDVAGAADELLKWRYAAGAVSPGLVKRRAAERTLFLRR